MLDNLVSKFKSKSSSSKKQDDEDNDSDEYSEQDSQDRHDSSNNQGDLNEEEQKKKKFSMILRVVVVLGLAYLAVDEVLHKGNQDKNEVVTVATKPRKPRKKNPEAKSEETPKVEAKTESSELSTNTEKKINEGEESPKPEVSNESPLPTENAAAVDTSTAAPVVTEAPVENINIQEKPKEESKSELPVVETTEQSKASTIGEAKKEKSPIDQRIDSLIEKVDNQEIKPNESEKKEAKLEDKIVEDDVYTAAPSYDQLGRGLVYNCKEGYWACLDKTSYVACNKNMKWNKSHGKNPECTVHEIYKSDEDCAVVQKYNVSTNKPTSFCQ